MPEFSRFKLEVGQLLWDGRSILVRVQVSSTARRTVCILCTVLTAEVYESHRGSKLNQNPLLLEHISMLHPASVNDER